MSQSLKYQGQCLCGQVCFELLEAPVFPHYCSCQQCQSWSGAPVVAWADFPLASLRHKGAEPVFYRSSAHTQRLFCAQCGSSLFALDDGSEWISVCLSSLTQAAELLPASHSFAESAPPWLKLALPRQEAATDHGVG